MRRRRSGQRFAEKVELPWPLAPASAAGPRVASQERIDDLLAESRVTSAEHGLP
jgi:hypothetical protein